MKKLICALLCALCLAGCGAAEEATTQTTTVPTTQAPTTMAETTAPPECMLAEGVYWNLDRKEYAGKSEAGMSSRTPDADGVYHIRFFCNGEVVEMTTTSKQVVNHIEISDLMGLQLDESGMIVDVVHLDDMPVQQIAWQFYVEIIDGNTITCNSSMSLNGMQQTAVISETTGIYDMSGRSGRVGTAATLKKMDRVLVIADEAGAVTDVFIVSRK